MTIVPDKDKIVPYEVKKDIYTKLKTSKILADFIKDNKEIDSDDFYEFAGDVIDELYGELEHKNFRSISHAAPWFSERQNILRKLLKENGVKITSQPVEKRPKLSYAQWCNRYLDNEK